MFKNRIIRKSIISNDSDETINTLLNEDYIYLTLKGSRMLNMFETDSVLLEIFREDIKRDYSKNNLIKESSYDLVIKNKRKALFEDLIYLVKEVRFSEDQYQSHFANHDTNVLFEHPFPITTRLLHGVEGSIRRSQNIDQTEKNNLILQIKEIASQSSETFCLL